MLELEHEFRVVDTHIEVEPDAVHVAINLSMFLSPIQGRVKDEAEDYLDRYLAS
jgi:hypothetical protein